MTGARIGVDVILRDAEGRILLHRRSDDNSWSLIGGWMENGETPDQAVRREAREESGLVIEVDELKDVCIRPEGTVHLTYLGHAVSGNLQFSDESFELRYWEFGEVPNWHHDHKIRIGRILQTEK
jgi:ADP-ribose pyrophosphatase YjhB (NUDIX family)